MKTFERSHLPPKLAAAFGMDPEARAALKQLEMLAESVKIGVAGTFMPDPQVGKRLTDWGIAEHIEETDFPRYTKIVLPFSGVPPRKKKDWEKAGVPLIDLTSPQVRRAQIALGLLRMDGAQPLVIGRHGDAETKCLASTHPGTRIIEDTTDTARLVFAPAFGVICQTTLSPRRVSWLVQQLRHRYNDARVTFLDTAAPGMAARDLALEKLMPDSDRVVIVGQPGESSCEALAETAMRKGKPSVIVANAEAPELTEFSLGERIALTAGAFALDSTIREVADALARR